ncbi:hypothetical protein B0H67DRAFT_228643 [Lasiosphaeris hirsuta]|uniref:Uncharacterized protein n=1 Tax=Lasiosphaeris hirsuta TaxID=260670 RepID=A0AA40DVP3_9PEZI|nr:hypothetical protein B0H67DRAFT_228643 [Lasiosphaeris hirsuta]
MAASQLKSHGLVLQRHSLSGADTSSRCTTTAAITKGSRVGTNVKMLGSLKARGYVTLPVRCQVISTTRPQANYEQGQDQSYFLHLSAEIRFKIYRLVYAVEERAPSPNDNSWDGYVAKHLAKLNFLREQLDQVSMLGAVCREMRVDVYGEFFHHTVFSLFTLKFSRRPHLDRPPLPTQTLCAG